MSHSHFGRRIGSAVQFVRTFAKYATTVGVNARPKRQFSTTATKTPTTTPSLTARQETILTALQNDLVLSPHAEWSVNPYELERHGRGESYHPSRPPDVIISPGSVEDVSKVLQFCNNKRIPVVPFGVGTSVEGHVCCLQGGISLNTQKLQHMQLPGEDDSSHSAVDDGDASMIMHDPIATCGAGVTRTALNDALRHTGLKFVVDPGANATLGGMAATGASGTTAVRYGTMRENVLQIECVLPDGTVLHAGTKALKNSAGYDLLSLLVGSEGTLGVITSITVKLWPISDYLTAATVSFDDLFAAANCVAMLQLTEIPVLRCELLDSTSVAAYNAYEATKQDRLSRRAPIEERPTLFLEFQASSQESLDDQVQQTESIAKDFGGSNFLFTSGEEERRSLWAARHELYYASIHLRPGATTAVLTDACVPLSKFAEIIQATALDVEEKGVVGPVFGHAGDGNFHCILPIMETDSDDYLARVHQVNDNLIQRTLQVGGTCTGEHGVGYGKSQYLDKQYGRGAIQTMKMIKSALDPNGIMNPGKIV